MKKIIIPIVFCLLVAGVAFAGGTVKQTFSGDGALVGTFAYPDGGAVDVTLDGNQAQFVAILPDGMVRRTPIILSCAATRAIATTNGRFVHLVTEGACGVYHWGWEIPDEMRGLNSVRIFAPMVAGG